MFTAKEAIDRVNAIFGSHPHTRALHAKGEFFTGTFTATPWATERCRAGHLNGDPAPVLVRWSNGSGHPKARDNAPDVRGMALSFTLPDGTVTDMVAQTAPRFPVRDPERFIQFTEAATKPTLPLFLLRNPSAVVPLIANAKSIVPPTSYASVTYFPIHAFKWIAADGTESWVRYRLTPAESTDPAGSFSGRDMLREELRARVAAGPIGYRLEVQVGGRGDDPHDPMSVWKGEWHDAGHISVTKCIGDPETGDHIHVFDPTRVTEGIGLSDDPILLFRREAYTESANRRWDGSK